MQTEPLSAASAVDNNLVGVDDIGHRTQSGEWILVRDPVDVVDLRLLADRWISKANGDRRAQWHHSLIGRVLAIIGESSEGKTPGWCRRPRARLVRPLPLHGRTQTGRNYGRDRWLEQHVYNTFTRPMCRLFWRHKTVQSLNSVWRHRRSQDFVWGCIFSSQSWPPF